MKHDSFFPAKTPRRQDPQKSFAPSRLREKTERDLLLGIDFGTGGCKVTVIDPSGAVNEAEGIKKARKSGKTNEQRGLGDTQPKHIFEKHNPLN